MKITDLRVNVFKTFKAGEVVSGGKKIMMIVKNRDGNRYSLLDLKNGETVSPQYVSIDVLMDRNPSLEYIVNTELVVKGSIK